MEELSFSEARRVDVCIAEDLVIQSAENKKSGSKKIISLALLDNEIFLLKESEAEEESEEEDYLEQHS